MKLSYRHNYATRGLEIECRDLVGEARSLMAALRDEGATYRLKQAEIAGSTYYSELEKQHLQKTLTREAPGRGRAAAQRLWDFFGPALDDVESAIRRSYREAPVWDYNRLSYLRDELASKIAAPVGLGGEGPIDRIVCLREEALARGDRHVLRALRLASEKFVNAPDLHDNAATARTRASELRVGFRRDEEGEAPEGVRDYEAEQSELQALQRQAEQLIRETERVFDPATPSGIFAGITSWGATVLHETPESTGGVCWSEKARMAAEAWAAQQQGAAGEGAGND